MGHLCPAAGLLPQDRVWKKGISVLPSTAPTSVQSHLAWGPLHMNGTVLTPWHRAGWHWNPQEHLCTGACLPFSVPGTALVLLHQCDPDVTTVGWPHACSAWLQSPACMHRRGLSPEGQAEATELGTLSGVLWAPTPCRERDQSCWRRRQETTSGLTRTAGQWLHYAAYCKPWLAIDHKALPGQASLLLSKLLEKPSDHWANARGQGCQGGDSPGMQALPSMAVGLHWQGGRVPQGEDGAAGQGAHSISTHLCSCSS